LTGESDEQKKVPLDLVPDHDEHKLSPFLVSGTKVVDGSGIMLVLAVGEFTC
jgi:magnesium-transporting ATPase (P-type)